MSLELRPHSKKFYARMTINGKRHAVALDIEYEGVPPAGLRMRLQGDADFERSRAKAEAKERVLLEKMKEPETKARVIERVHKVLTGETICRLRIGELLEVAKRTQRKRKWSPAYEKQVTSLFDCFLSFLKQFYKQVDYADSVTPSIANDFLSRYEAERNCTGKSMENIRMALRGLYSVAEKQQLVSVNPFRSIQCAESISVNHEPFSLSQLERVIAECKRDETLSSIVIVGASTGMRLKDCALLQWTSVSLESNEVRVRTFKTRTFVKISILPLLREILLKAKESTFAVGGFVFPDAANQYRKDRSSFSRFFAQALLRAGFSDEYGLPESLRAPRDGSRGRAACRFGFSSLKTTFVTMALSNGVSMSQIQQICGNEIPDIVLMHYFRPDSDSVRASMMRAMPRVLGGECRSDGSLGVIARLQDCLSQMQGTDLEVLRAQITRVLQDWAGRQG